MIFQPYDPNSRKRLQHQASQAHIAGLAVDKKKRISSNQKAKQLANAFPTSYCSDSDQQHFAHAHLAVAMQHAGVSSRCIRAQALTLPNRH
jgi:hypothetical protein